MDGMDLYTVIRQLDSENQRLDRIVGELESLDGGARRALIFPARDGADASR